ncbi:MAG: SPOR domain-containing protein [Prevotella sp.]|jgi:hypothetical protein|nr:SPOR domain-containing protein [Prevotella sp.]
MKETLFKYLEFLLPIHNCVTIPELGGFIINVSSSSMNASGDIDKPQYTIVFNPELNHDDGIITSCIVKDENISYNAAYKRIKDCVKDITYHLKNGDTVSCGNIGILKSDDKGVISFYYKKDNPLPSLFGLDRINIKHLDRITKEALKQKQKRLVRYALSGAASLLIAVSLFVGPSINIEDQKTSNKADFISSITSSLSVSENESSIPAVSETEKDITSNNVISEKKQRTRNYYIIVGGEENKSRAEKLLLKIQNEGLPNASMLKSPDRYRIYVSAFTDKSQAEIFLDSFRKKNPQYTSAWLYSK